MYVWIWRKLPGGVPGKLVGSLLLLAAVVALLFFVVFPWVEPKLPWNHVNVSGNGGATAAPSATAGAVPGG